MGCKTSKKCATINDLPNELVILIFGNLEIKHLIQCSLVCRRFKLLCQGVKVPQLIISNTSAKNLKDHWFLTNKQFNYENAISVTTFNSHKSTFRLNKFRRLYFDGYSSEYAQLKLNEFTHLEQVAINFHFPDRDDVRHEFHINLPNLKIIEIDSKTNQHKFFITTPELEMLKYTKFSSIDLTYVDTIRHLETDFVTESCHLLDEEEIPLIKHISDLKLTTLSCNSSYIGSRLEVIKKLVQEKQKHRRSLPKIYFLSVEVDDVERINEYESHRDKFLFQISNYNLLAETVSKEVLLYHEINYDQLMTTMKGKIPDDFCKKFSSARKVCVNEKVESPEHLIGFLKNFEYLQELRLKSDPLDESFYGQLGDLDQLMSLSVYDSSRQPVECSKLTFNFDFLLRLKHLGHFNTNFDTPNSLDLALELFEQSKYFRWMRFYFEGKFAFIYVDPFYDSNVYNLLYDGCEKRKLDISKLVRAVNAIRGLY